MWGNRFDVISLSLSVCPFRFVWSNRWWYFGLSFEGHCCCTKVWGDQGTVWQHSKLASLRNKYKKLCKHGDIDVNFRSFGIFMFLEKQGFILLGYSFSSWDVNYAWLIKIFYFTFCKGGYTSLSCRGICDHEDSDEACYCWWWEEVKYVKASWYNAEQELYQ